MLSGRSDERDDPIGYQGSEKVADNLESANENSK